MWMNDKPVFLDIQSMATSVVSIFVLSICRFEIGDISCVDISIFADWYFFFCVAAGGAGVGARLLSSFDSTNRVRR